jgi:hypothetical protein
MLDFALSTGLPAAMLAMLFAALMWMRIDTVWSEVHPLHWLSLASLGPVAALLATLLHAVMPSATAVEPALLVAVSVSLTWWGLRLRVASRREQQRN